LAVPGLAAPIPLPASSRGGPLALAVRPEKLRLSPERPDGFALAATVASVGYLGPVSIVRLALGDGRLLTARMQGGLADGLDRGASVWVAWRPEDAILVAR
jgi:ABC-type Fe3+/spermidine/putrescine transport system ATPase subunit